MTRKQRDSDKHVAPQCPLEDGRAFTPCESPFGPSARHRVPSRGTRADPAELRAPPLRPHVSRGARTVVPLPPGVRHAAYAAGTAGWC